MLWKYSRGNEESVRIMSKGHVMLEKEGKTPSQGTIAGGKSRRHSREGGEGTRPEQRPQRAWFKVVITSEGKNPLKGPSQRKEPFFKTITNRVFFFKRRLGPGNSNKSSTLTIFERGGKSRPGDDCRGKKPLQGKIAWGAGKRCCQERGEEPRS